MAYCPSPDELRSVVTPDIFWMMFPTVMSGDSSMARELITLTTFIEFRSIMRAPVSVLDAEAVTTTSDSWAVDSVILMVKGAFPGSLMTCVS